MPWPRIKGASGRNILWLHGALSVALLVIFLSLLVIPVSDGPRNDPANAAPHVGAAKYLDYTGAGVYADGVIDRYQKDLLGKFRTRLDGEQDMAGLRSDILRFVKADPNVYTVVFVASATQALKFVGERYPFRPGDVLAYTDVNHNSVLGIRKYALDKGANFTAIPFPPTLGDISNFSGGVLAFPLEDNFAGMKPDISFLSKLGPEWTVIADAAAYIPTNPLDLSESRIDAAVMSFYKIFGVPNTGCLVIRKALVTKLGGAHEEDPVPWQMNLAVRHALTTWDTAQINAQVWKVTQRFASGLSKLRHSTGALAAVLYGLHDENDPSRQGGVVSFLLKRTNGSFIGYSSVVAAAAESGFHLRGGCHCNPGACFKFMKLSEASVKEYFGKKTSCGDGYDEIGGVPLGSVRASFGWTTTEAQVDAFLDWIRENYVM